MPKLCGKLAIFFTVIKCYLKQGSQYLGQVPVLSLRYHWLTVLQKILWLQYFQVYQSNPPKHYSSLVSGEQ
jgi:hypothetical protein